MLDQKCPTGLRQVKKNYQVPLKYVAAKGAKRAKKAGKERNRMKKHKKWNQKRTCTHGAGRALRRQGCCFCLIVVRSVHYDVSRWSTTGGLQKWRNGRKTSQEEGKEREPKQPTVVDRSEVGLFACCFGVIRCDVAWYIAIYHDIRSHSMRYHKHTIYIEISSYPYPEFWTPTARYRIPPKYFKIPNSSQYLWRFIGDQLDCRPVRWLAGSLIGRQ